MTTRDDRAAIVRSLPVSDEPVRPLVSETTDPRDLTDDEQEVLRALVSAWNKFVLLLPVEHPDDTDEFRHHIHALQMQIMARPVRRNLGKPV